MSALMTSDRPAEPGRVARAFAWASQHGPAALVGVLMSIVAPYVIYSLANRVLGSAGALMVGAVPPIARAVFEFARHRRVDALSLIVLTGIAFSLIAFFGGGGVRFLQLREHLVAAAIGLVFLGSATIGKPLIYQLARARLRRRAEHDHLRVIESLSDHPIFRAAMLTMTLAWGFGLIAESAVASALVFLLPIPTFLMVSGILGFGAGISLTAWTFWYARRRVLAARAAIAEEGGPGAG